jgi:hypothetical protein
MNTGGSNAGTLNIGFGSALTQRRELDAGTLSTGFFGATTQVGPNPGWVNLGTGNSGFGQTTTRPVRVTQVSRNLGIDNSGHTACDPGYPGNSGALDTGFGNWGLL